jgi:hypothetical protein
MTVRSILAACAAFSLAACAAGNTTPHAGGTEPQAHTAKITFRIRVPKTVPAKRFRVMQHGKPAYISPAAQGMTVSIAGPIATSATFGLTPGSPGCSGGPSGTSCTISLPGLKPCAGSTACYTATVATYDEVGCATTCSIPDDANELSAAQQIAFGVSEGAANDVNVTLGGIPARIIVTPEAVGYLQGDGSGLKLYGAGAQQLVVETQDIDDNSIVGPGAPAISAASSSSTLAVSAATPRNPNLFAVQAQTVGIPRRSYRISLQSRSRPFRPRKAEPRRFTASFP